MAHLKVSRSNSVLSDFIGAAKSCPNFISIFYLFLVLNFSLPAGATEIYLSQNTFSDSQAVPLIYAKEKWNSDYTRGSYSHSYVWSETGLRTKHWGVGLLYRFDIQAKYNSDTVDFLFRVKNKRELTPEKKYQLKIDINQLRTFGSRISYRNIHNGLRYNIGVSILRAHTTTQGTLQGHAEILTQKDYEFEFDTDYFYSTDYLFDRQVQQPTGFGLSTDASFSLNIGRYTRLSVQTTDIIGFIYWSKAARTVATGDSSVRNYDENGYLRYEPYITGTESYEKFIQFLRPRVILSASYHRKWFATKGELYYTNINSYLIPSIGVRLTGEVLLLVSRVLPTTATKLGMTGKTFGIEIFSDHWDYQKMHSAGLNFTFNIQFK